MPGHNSAEISRWALSLGQHGFIYISFSRRKRVKSLLMMCGGLLGSRELPFLHRVITTPKSKTHHWIRKSGIKRLPLWKYISRPSWEDLQRNLATKRKHALLNFLFCTQALFVIHMAPVGVITMCPMSSLNKPFSPMQELVFICSIKHLAYCEHLRSV